MARVERVMERRNKMNGMFKNLFWRTLCPGQLLGHPTSHSYLGLHLHLGGLSIYIKSVPHSPHLFTLLSRRDDVVANGATEGMLRPKSSQLSPPFDRSRC